jgi:hypothetical protein
MAEIVEHLLSKHKAQVQAPPQKNKPCYNELGGRVAQVLEFYPQSLKNFKIY